MSEIARHQLLITLVHGTWGRGFFPSHRRQNQRPLWFEEGSPFLTRLSIELGDIPHKITPLLWSGANSIFERDKTAHILAQNVSDEHAEHPQATQLIVAHSHGGNIALRALHHLQKRDASRLCGADTTNPLLVTLATPFVEVHPADFGRRPTYVRLALLVAMWVVLIFILFFVFPSLLPDELRPDESVGIDAFMVTVAGAGLMGWWWIGRRALARRSQLAVLNDATRLGEGVSAHAQRLLIIRAIDDEASLTLALGTIFSYVTARSIQYVFLLFTLLFGAWIVIAFITAQDVALVWAGGFAVLTIMLFGTLMVSRSVHGRELAVRPMECQINTQSVPDAADLSKIVTLVSRTYLKSLRHGIYDHEDCAKAISDWVRSQLCALPVR
jgi:hypothetical protein